MGRGNILIVDDEMEIRDFLRDFFEDREFNVEIASDGERALEIFRGKAFDLVISDMLMPRMIGIELLRQIREIKPEQRVMLMTGVKEKSMVEKAQKLGCHLYLTKPVSLAELEARVDECFSEE